MRRAPGPETLARRFALCDAIIAACNAEKGRLAKSLTPGQRPPKGRLRLMAKEAEIAAPRLEEARLVVRRLLARQR